MDNPQSQTFRISLTHTIDDADTEFLDISGGPTRTRLELDELIGFSGFNAVASRIGPRLFIVFEEPVSEGMEIEISLLGTGEHITAEALTVTEKPAVGGAIAALVDEPAPSWEEIYKFRLSVTDPMKNFFFELDRRSNPALRPMATDLDADLVRNPPALLLEGITSDIQDILFERVGQRWADPNPAVLSVLDDAMLNQIDIWFTDSATASGVVDLPQALEDFAAGLLRDSVPMPGAVSMYAGDADSAFVFYFAEVAFAALEAIAKYGAAAPVTPGFWTMDLLRAFIRMQPLFLSRHDVASHTMMYKLPGDAVVDRFIAWIHTLYEGVPVAMDNLAMEYHRNLRVAGASGV